MILFGCAGIALVGVLDLVGVVSTVGDNKYETAALAAIYYGMFGGGGGLILWAFYRRFRPRE
jgi:hypothetical protein